MRRLHGGTIASLALVFFLAQPVEAASPPGPVGVPDLATLGLLLAGVFGLSRAGSQLRLGPRPTDAACPRPAGRRIIAAGLLGLLLLLLPAGVAHAGTLNPFGDHTGQDHSFENHANELLNDIILSSADLTSTSLKNSILTDAIMLSATLTGADLMNADFSGADLTGSTATGARVRNATFSGAILDSADFSGSDVKNAVFVGASLLGADFSGLADADKADFTGAFYDAATILDPGIDTSGMIFVPEPGTGALMGLGLGLGAALSRRTAVG